MKSGALKFDMFYATLLLIDLKYFKSSRLVQFSCLLISTNGFCLVPSGFISFLSIELNSCRSAVYYWCFEIKILISLLICYDMMKINIFSLFY